MRIVFKSYIHFLMVIFYIDYLIMKPNNFYILFKVSVSWIESMFTLFVCNKKLTDYIQSLFFKIKMCPDTCLKIFLEINQIGQDKFLLQTNKVSIDETLS